MKTVKKEILINADIYLTFSSKLMELKEIVTGETQTLLLELTEILQKEMTETFTFYVGRVQATMVLSPLNRTVIPPKGRVRDPFTNYE